MSTGGGKWVSIAADAVNNVEARDAPARAIDAGAQASVRFSEGFGLTQRIYVSLVRAL
jgi:hypothetical protein